MEFAHITKEKNFTVEESIEVIFKDSRYPNTDSQIYLSLKDAHTMVRELSNFIADIPY